MDPENVRKMGGNRKIPRGCRLKAVTHKRIREIQMITNGSQDSVISTAIRLYSKKLAEKSKGK